MAKGRRITLYYIYSILIILIVYFSFQLIRLNRQEKQLNNVTEGVVFEDTLVVMVTEIPEHLNPYTVVYDEDIFLLNQIYRGLTRINVKLEEAPDLAEYWEVSPDRKTYTFVLRDNIYFHDGSPVTAEDFLKSFTYFFNHYPENYAVSYFKIIKGLDAFLDGRSQHISGVKKLSDRKIAITLNKPYVPFPKLLSLPQVKILPAEALTGEMKRNRNLPPGNGPYQLAKITPDEIVLKRFNQNKIYHPEVAFYKIYPILTDDEFNSHFDDYLNQKFDLTFLPDETFDEHPGFLEIKKNSTFNLVFIGFNCSLFPTDSRNFRKAIFNAYDADLVSDLYGEYAVKADFISPLLLSRRNENMNPLSKDMALAKLFYAKANPDDKHITASLALDTVNYFFEFDDEVRNIADTLGFGLESHFYDEFKMQTQQRIFESVNIFFYDWQMDLPDPEFYFDLLFKSDSPMNLFGYKNPRVDSLLELAYYESAGTRRRELYTEVEQIIAEDAPLRPLVFYEDFLIHQDYVKNAYLSRMGISALELDKIQVDTGLYKKHHWKSHAQTASR